MVIDKELILKLENLSRLELSEAERDRMVEDLRNILRMVDKLNELNTNGVMPLKYLTEVFADPRQDIAEEFHEVGKALDLAPEKEGNYIVIPKVINK